MKITTILLFSACLTANAGGFAQKVTLSAKNVKLEKVFKEIKKQTDYVFFYDARVLQGTQTVNIHVNNETVEEVLKEILKGQALDFSIERKTITIVQKAGYSLNRIHANFANLNMRVIHPVPVKVINGTVKDDKGNPLSGVSVVVKGTTKGTSTATDGSFSIEANVGDVLEFTMVGYQKKSVTVGQNTNLTAVMEIEVSIGNEVVVVGYGTKKRANLTGAVEQINAEDIALRPVSSIGASLQGLLPGLNIQSNTGNPGQNPDINIRGFNSLNGGGPLILVDGIEGDIERINPIDIETITVLKDAASSAIYGARGAFGVILITTKKGKEGKMSFKYTNNFGVTTPTTRTDYISDPYVYAKTVDAALNGYNGTTYSGYTDEDYEIIKKVASGEIAPYQELQTNGTYKFYGNTNWYNYLFRKWQPTESHNISISGGSKKIQAYLSGRYFKSTGIQNIVDAPLTKYNLKANVNFQATDWLQISDNVQVSTSDQMEYGGAATRYGGIWSTTTWYFQFPFYPNKIDGIPFDYQGGAAHPALENASNWKRYYSEQLVNTISAKLTPLKGLEVNFDYSNNMNHVANTTRLNTYSRLTGNKILSQTTGINRLTESRNRNYYKALNLYGNYSKDLTDHHFKLLLGYNQESYTSDNILAEQGGLLFNDLSNLNLGTELLAADGSASIWAVRGYFGRFNYDYKDRYLLEVNSRYDGSSRFPEHSRWGLFPSISAGWVASREKFWQPLKKVVSSFKLRGSYGKLGNQNVGLYTFSQILGLGQSSWLADGTRLNYAGLPAPLPGAVSWESTKTIDFGADFAFFRNRLTASFDWYEKNTSGMYLPGEPLPAVFGAAEPKENIASLRNRGFEFSLGYNNQFRLKGSMLHIRATASVYDFNGVITKYPNPNGIMSTYWEGQKLGQIWGYHIDGQFQSNDEAAAYQNSFSDPSKDLGQVYKFIINIATNSEWKGLKAGDVKYIDKNGDGAINKGKYTLEDHGDLEPIGNAMPQYPFGFSFAADWKGFDISMAGAGVARQDWYPTGDIYWGTYERPYMSFIRKDLIENAWTPEKPGNTYPQIDRGYTSLGASRSLGEVNDYYLTNVGYLRIRNLTIGYTLPSSLTQKIHIQKFRAYLSAENIFTWRFGNLTKYIDPEQAGSGINYNNPGDAVERARLEDWPIGKTFSVGISLTL